MKSAEWYAEQKLKAVELYADKNIWSQRFKAWDKYRVRKPRMPKPEDLKTRWVDSPLNKPANIPSMLGKHNNEIIASLKTLREEFEDSKILPAVVIISGPSGSGKTTLVQKFAIELAEDMALTKVQESKFFLYVDIAHYKTLNNLWQQITKFAEPVIERFITAPFRVVIIDNAQLMPPSQQQGLKKVMEIFFLRTKWIFVSSKPEKLITFIQSNATKLQTYCILEKDALLVILAILFKNKIGFEREGVQAVFDMHRSGKDSMSLSKMLDYFQKVFMTLNYISKENAVKVSGRPFEPLTIPSIAAIHPMERCRICTLVPPCKHVSLEQMSEWGIARRDELSVFPGGLACQEFVRCGRCSSFNTYGHCSLDHPKHLHRLEPPPPRCSQCTIPWPCNHCAYSVERNRLIALLAELKERIHLLKQLDVPEPSLALANYMDQKFVVWRPLVTKLSKEHLQVQKKQELLATTVEWLDTSLSTDIGDYIFKATRINLAYGDVLYSALLKKREAPSAAYGKAGGAKNAGASTGEEGGEEEREGAEELMDGATASVSAPDADEVD